DHHADAGQPARLQPAGAGRRRGLHAALLLALVSRARGRAVGAGRGARRERQWPLRRWRAERPRRARAHLALACVRRVDARSVPRAALNAPKRRASYTCAPGGPFAATAARRSMTSTAARRSMAVGAKTATRLHASAADVYDSRTRARCACPGVTM